jgi:hypothetical protein
MTGPPPLRDDGREEDRVLLRAALPVVPAGLPERVLRAVEARFEPRRPRRIRLVWAAIATLVSGVAFASVWRARHPASPVPVLAPPPAPVVEPRRALPPPRPVHHRRPRPVHPSAPPAPVQIAAVRPPPPPPPPVVSRLVLSREGKADIALDVTADGIRGHVRGTPVALRVSAASVSGKIGDEPVALWLLGGRRAEGTIFGQDVLFELTPTDQGHLLRGSVPGHGVRLDIGPAALHFMPGCDQPLAAAGAGVYQGRCASGRRVKVEIPPAMLQMPPLARMLLLGMILTERDPVLELQDRDLWPAEH